MSDDGPLDWKHRLPCGGYPATSCAMDRWSTETSSPSWETYAIGELIERIVYHPPQGEGDAHYCDAYFVDGHVERLFRPRSVRFDP